MSDPLTIQFIHQAYQLAADFSARGRGEPSFQSWSPEEAGSRLDEADVIVTSGLWRNEWLSQASRLKYIHVCGAGYDNFDLDALKARHIRFCNSSGVNVNAVSDHGMALLLTLTRQVHLARDRQARAEWRGMISDISRREDELAGKTLLIYGLGAIGRRLARLAHAFDMQVIGIRRSSAELPDGVAAIHSPAEFLPLLSDVDVVALTCPLTDETRNLINAEALGRMKPSSYLLNLARGAVVNEQALIDALDAGKIAGAGLDVFDPEPLPIDSRLWGYENVVITPHTAGETQQYEKNVNDFLIQNLGRLQRGLDVELVNQII